VVRPLLARHAESRRSAVASRALPPRRVMRGKQSEKRSAPYLLG